MANLFEQVSSDIRTAMKARDKVRLEALRNIKKCFIEAKTAPGANDTLEDAAALKILQKLAKQGEESADTYAKAKRQDLADAELAQVALSWRRSPSSRNTFPSPFPRRKSLRRSRTSSPRQVHKA